MTLAEYLVEMKTTEAEIARRAMLSQPTVNRVRNGVGNPSFDVLRRIQRATEDRVTPNDFVNCSTRQTAAE